MEIKRCGDCGRFLGESSFHWENKKKGYKSSYCKKCDSNRRYLWGLDNKEYYLEYHRQYREDNKEQIKVWREDNTEYFAEYNKQYRVDNREHLNNRSRQYQKDNPDKVNATNAKYKTAKKNQTPTLTETEKRKVYYLYKFSSILGKYFVVDHIQPISEGGTHHPDNLQILTHTLNLEKGSKWPLTEEEKIKYEGFII